MTQIFLLQSAPSVVSPLRDPGNWNPVNKVECYGPGGAGSTGQANWEGGGGGGGGAYAFADNVKVTFPTSYFVGASFVTNFNAPTNNGQWPWWWEANYPNAVSAPGGTSGTAWAP